MKYYCIGHKAPIFSPSVHFIHVSPTAYPELHQLIIPDDLYGEKFDGRILSEYAQLFGLADHLKNTPKDERFYIFQYRKFISFRPGYQLSTNQPYSYACSSEDGGALFPSKDELSTLGDTLLLGPAIKIRSIAHNFSVNHLIEDFAKFILSLNTLNGFNQKRCADFISCEMLIPAPSLGVTRVDIFLKHMACLRLVWEHFSNNFLIPHDGYQRRVGGFILERLHSFLLYEEINILKNVAVFQGNQIVISPSPVIEPTI